MNTLSYPQAPGYKAHGPSKEAAEKIEPKSHTLRKQVLECVKNSIFGLTADEAAERLNASILSVRPRFSELRKTGLIVDTGARRNSSSGNRQSVWRAA